MIPCGHGSSATRPRPWPWLISSPKRKNMPLTQRSWSGLGFSIQPRADAVVLLAGSPSWSVDDQNTLDAWGNTYLDWLLTSKNGADECAAKNNHGTWYDVQAAHWALVLGRKDVAKKIITLAATKRVAVQVEPDGRQPLELVRTASFSYSCFNALALSELAALGEHAGFDLWHFKTSEGRSIRAALDFLVPYLGKNPLREPLTRVFGSS
ncbi:MAG: hypothetical protein EBU04_06520 [Verrucomicrobia bacterium]|nr:hypothetical protein [Verrucomicrobiota bacterium]